MLSEYFPQHTYVIVAGVVNGHPLAVVAGAILDSPTSLGLRFPGPNPFVEGQAVTMHLDNRRGGETYDSDLTVYRVSVKARVQMAEYQGARVIFEEYQLFYGSRVVENYTAKGYQHTPDPREPQAIRAASLKDGVLMDESEFENKLGVLVTMNVDRPHTTVMAFLSSTQDDIFIISHDNTWKSHNLARDPHCLFAIDHRATYHFEKAFEWNYTIIKAEATMVPPEDPHFTAIQQAFITKNPWELAFFSDPRVRMYHLTPQRIIFADTL